ncbi:MAG: TerC family protein [Janthinobacterium lividum]
MTATLMSFLQGLSLDQSLLLPLLGIIWINLLLSGDNAVVIALVCRRLPTSQQRAGLVLGSLAAVVLRIAMAFVVSYLLRVEGLRIVAGLFLLYVAAKLVWDEAGHEAEAKPAVSLWSAVVAITVADVGMSLDNVLAIAALARDNATLLVIGIALSVPLVIMGATIVKAVVDRLPIVVWFGAGLLGWVAIDILNDDPLLEAIMHAHPTVSLSTDTLSMVVGAVLVLGVGAGRRLAR